MSESAVWPTGLGWYLRRLRVMSPAELWHRVQERVHLRRLRREHASRSVPGPVATQLAFCGAGAPQLPQLPFDLDPSAAEQASLLAGRHPALGFDWQWRDDPQVWHTAPDTGRPWPQVFFGDIDYRGGNPHGDARVVWEPSRLQQLVDLALLARGRPDAAEAAVDLLERQLLSWWEVNPPLRGIHYVSAMECALRLMAVCHAVDLVRDRLRRRDQVWAAVAGIVWSHAQLIASRLSRHSSANNHAVAEAAGLVYAGALFPELDAGTRWLLTGTSLLAHEAPRQVAHDGGGQEQALAYLRLVRELLVLAAGVLAARGHPVPVAVSAAGERAGQFLAGLGDAQGVLPPIGDGDGGHALSRHLRLPLPGVPTPPWRTYSDSGYTLVRGLSPGPLRLIFDHGSLGLPPAYGHGHADALAVVLYLGEQAILIDPGTYTYTGEPVWRAYFRGTRAHNTVLVDGRDQARQETSFIWSGAYRARLLACEELRPGGVRLIAGHDGYRRAGVMHYRALVLRFGGPLLIWDRLEGTGEHDLELNWHLGVDAMPTAGGCRLQTPAGLWNLEVQGGHLRVDCGALAPLRGWRSDLYGSRRQCDTLWAQRRTVLPHEFVTVVGPAGLSWPRAVVDRELALLRERVWNVRSA